MRLKNFRFITVIISLLGAVISAGTVRAETATIAVASNFLETAQQLALQFQRNTEHNIRISSGSSGKIVTQIIHGAPFDAFLAADISYPKVLIEKGHADPSKLFTYAVGKLVLFGNTSGRPLNLQVLRSPKVKRIATANPGLAPYGKAAFEYLERTDALPQVRSRLVYGNNIAQTYQFIATGNAEIGFVALPQVISKPKSTYIEIPQEHYTPLKQGALLIKRGANNQAAVEFLTYLRSAEARAIIRRQGYDVSEEG